jgi:hypothetical protein
MHDALSGRVVCPLEEHAVTTLTGLNWLRTVTSDGAL